MAEKLHDISGETPNDGGSGSDAGPPAIPAQPHDPPNDKIDFSQVPVTGRLQISEMNVDDARLAISHLESALRDAKDAHDHCNILRNIEGPGLEPASQGYASNAKQNGDKHQMANKQLQNNIEAEIHNLRAAIRQLTGTEETNQDNIRKLK